MLEKMPWLVSRRRLLLLSFIDYLIIVTIFLILQNLKIINTNFLAINILAACWIITNYILDKYSILEDYIDNNLISKFSRIFKSYIISGILFKIVIIFFYFLNANVGEGKWIIFLAIVSIISFLYEISHTYLIKKYISNRINWISIFSSSESAIIGFQFSN